MSHSYDFTTMYLGTSFFNVCVNIFASKRTRLPVFYSAGVVTHNRMSDCLQEYVSKPYKCKLGFINSGKKYGFTAG
jgi:hypothetical protein